MPVGDTNTRIDIHSVLQERRVKNADGTRLDDRVHAFDETFRPAWEKCGAKGQVLAQDGLITMRLDASLDRSRLFHDMAKCLSGAMDADFNTPFDLAVDGRETFLATRYAVTLRFPAAFIRRFKPAEGETDPTRIAIEAPAPIDSGSIKLDSGNDVLTMSQESENLLLLTARPGATVAQGEVVVRFTASKAKYNLAGIAAGLAAIIGVFGTLFGSGFVAKLFRREPIPKEPIPKETPSE